MKTQIEFTRVNNDVNGNPRYVCHFLDVLTESEKENARLQANPDKNIWGIDVMYKTAIKKANKIGGRKFHNKQYGGGIVFQSYNIAQTERDILELLK